jgi:Cys-tRNA(Pro)/Cys-tRNA(Cys) deacylase
MLARPMASRETPATRAARAAGIAFTVHEYEHDPAAPSFAEEAAQALGLDPAQVCVVPADARLDLKALGKHAQMADPKRAERVTGYVVGGISPLGQRRPLRTVVDEHALLHDTVHVSAGRRGLEIELAPNDLVALTDAEVRPVASA